MGSILFEPARIGKKIIKNRLVRAPTVEKLAGADGECTPELIQHYFRLAEGGIGLAITGGAYVKKNGQGLPNMIGLHNDGVIAGYKKLTDLMHQYNVTVFAQLYHCGRQGVSEILGATPVAPSAVPNALGITPEILSSSQIAETVNSFILAAQRAKEAGFDGVQIHAAHGYLVHQFLSPRTNLREDQWGGNFDNRMKFLVSIYRGIRDELAADFPILLRINWNDYLEGGLGIEDATRIAQHMSSLGADAIEISSGTWESHFFMARGDIPRNYWLYRKARMGQKEIIKRNLKCMAEKVRFKEAYNLYGAKEIKKKVNCPIILVGGIRDVSVMEKIILERDADFISLCRPLIRDPEFPNLIRRGLVKKSNCLNCNLCLSDKPALCYQLRLRPPHF